MASYKTFDVQFEHTADGGTKQVNRQTITIYGESELKARAELESSRHNFKEVVILEMEET